MDRQSLTERHTLFTIPFPDWDLNIHVINGEKSCYLIDSGVGYHNIKPILDFIRGFEKPIRLINTHYHWDHVLGNQYVDAQLIISHHLCYQLIQENWAAMAKQPLPYLQETEDVRMVLPNVLFNQRIIFAEDGIECFHTPGHSIDGISVYDHIDKIINVGDQIGDNDLEIVPELETEVAVYRKSLIKIGDIDFTRCISGHNHVQNHDVIDRILKKL